MTGELIIAILAGLGGMLGWGLADFLAKKTIDEIGDVPSLVWGHVFGTCALFLILILQIHAGNTTVIPTEISVWLGLLGFGVLQAIVYYFVYKGFGKGQIGVLSPVFASFTGITALLSILFFNEVIHKNIVIGLIIIFIGIILINTDMSALRSKKIGLLRIPGFKEIILATILAALWTLFWDRFIGQDWVFYTFYMYGFMTLAVVVAAKISKANLRIVRFPVRMLVAFIGIGEVVAYLAISWGYSRTSHTSIVALLSGAFSLPVIVLARIFLKERITRTQTVAGIIIIVGIITISLL